MYLRELKNVFILIIINLIVLKKPSGWPYFGKSAHLLGNFGKRWNKCAYLQALISVPSLTKILSSYLLPLLGQPSHSDKAANLEVLKWTNDLAKFRKQLKGEN